MVKSHVNQIFNYAEFRKSNPSLDLSLLVSPPVAVSADQSITINLSLFTDGVNIKKSTVKKPLWPVWIQLTDLPPILRMSRKNIVLAALFVERANQIGLKSCHNFEQKFCHP